MPENQTPLSPEVKAHFQRLRSRLSFDIAFMYKPTPEQEDTAIQAALRANFTLPMNLGKTILRCMKRDWVKLANTLLTKATLHGRKEFNLDIATTKKGLTSIQIAAKKGNLAAVKLLLAYGANPFQLSRGLLQESALTYALKGGHQEIVDSILESSAPLSAGIAKAIAISVFTDQLALTRKLCEKAKKELAREVLADWLINGVRSLAIAVGNRNKELILLLMDYGANPHLEDEYPHPTDKSLRVRKTPFQLAHKLEDESVAVTIASHPDFLPPDDVAKVVFQSVQRGWITLTRLLLENARKYHKDLCLNTVKENEKTSIHIAAEQGNVAAVELLLGYGAGLGELSKKINGMPSGQIREIIVEYITHLYGVKYPDHLTNNYIHKLGDEYIQKYGEEPSLWSRHRSQPVAKMLQNFSGTLSKERWEFLASCYGKLANHKGDLAAKIRQLFHSAFREEINYSGLSISQVETLLMSKIAAHYPPPLSFPNDPPPPYSQLYPHLINQPVSEVHPPSTPPPTGDAYLYPSLVGNEFINPPVLNEIEENLTAWALTSAQPPVANEQELISFEKEPEQPLSSTISSAQLTERTLMDLTEEEIKQITQPTMQLKSPGRHGLFSQVRQPTSEELVKQLASISVPKGPLLFVDDARTNIAPRTQLKG